MAKRIKAASSAPKDPEMKALQIAQASTDKEKLPRGWFSRGKGRS